MDNLPQLRDIHLPEDGVSIFPLAYGWWGILIAVFLVYLAAIFFVWLRRASAKIYARHLLADANDDNPVRAATQMSEILRRICVRKYPDAVALSGKKWIEFLNSKSKLQIDDEAAKLLNDAPFAREGDVRYQKDKLYRLRQFCYVWIGENLW